MIKIIKEQTKDTIKMRDMKPFDIGIVQGSVIYSGHTVMRTASQDTFEVMDLTDPGKSHCFDAKVDRLVKLLPPDECVTVEFFNEPDAI